MNEQKVILAILVQPSLFKIIAERAFKNKTDIMQESADLLMAGLEAKRKNRVHHKRGISGPSQEKSRSGKV